MVLQIAAAAAVETTKRREWGAARIIETPG